MLNRYSEMFFLCFIFVFSTVSCFNVESGNPLNISLENFNKTNINGQAFLKYAELHPLDPLIIQIVDVPVEVTFVIVQAHVQEPNVSLTVFNATDEENVYGSNLGFKLDSEMINQKNISVTSNYIRNVTALIAVVAYTEKAPIPGECTKQSSANVFPIQKIETTNALLIIEAGPASAPFTSHQLLCDNSTSITYEIYRLYASHYDFTNQTYFSAISKMLTVDDIIKNGKKIPLPISSSSMKMIYASYLGVGSTYAVIAKYGNYSAAYVPAFSYGCNPILNEESCYFLSFTISKVLCAAVFCSGILLIFLGKHTLYGSMMITSVFLGGIIGYIVLCAFGIDDINWLVGGSIIIGIIGILAVTIISIFIPCIVFLPTPLSVGFLVASITYFGVSDEVSLFKNNSTFWPIYGSIVLLIALLFSRGIPIQNSICSTILGSYGIILSIDYWANFNLKYIVINTIRRLIIKDFDTAFISPPIRSADIWLCVLWVVLILFVINFKPVSYIIVKSSGALPKVSAVRGYRRVIPLRVDDEVSFYRV